MLKSILKVFSGAFGMIIRVMVIIGLCFLGGYCLFSMLARPFFWGLRTGRLRHPAPQPGSG